MQFVNKKPENYKAIILNKYEFLSIHSRIFLPTQNNNMKLEYALNEQSRTCCVQFCMVNKIAITVKCVV